MEDDVKYMRMAVELAERGRGFTNPNPIVGAVIVRDGEVMGCGWHRGYGMPHAEREALADCREDVGGAVLYVTLEPCCHHGKTPPCTDAVIEAGIRKVVMGMEDPNPLVAGKGKALLEAAGIEVVCGVEAGAVRAQNKVFVKYVSEGMPWIAVKTAMTLDGKIASPYGDTMRITGEEARLRVHGMRAEFMGIVVGARTAAIDDPLLNCRLEGKHRQPVRIVVSSRAILPPQSRILATAALYPLIVAHTEEAPEGNLERIRRAGGETLLCGSCAGGVDTADMARRLGKRGMDSLLVEGGGNLNFSVLRQGLADEVYAFIAPAIAGGRNTLSPVEGEGFEEMLSLENMRAEFVGADLLVHAYIRK